IERRILACLTQLCEISPVDKICACESPQIASAVIDGLRYEGIVFGRKWIVDAQLIGVKRKLILCKAILFLGISGRLPFVQQELRKEGSVTFLWKRRYH